MARNGATVSRHPARKPRQGERHERANEVLRWRGVYPDPQPALAPDALLLAAQRLGVDIGRALMVGDSMNDVGAARNAGCPVVAVPYGYNHGHDIHDARPDAVIDSIADLWALLKQAA